MAKDKFMLSKKHEYLEEIGKEISEKARAVFDYFSDKN